MLNRKSHIILLCDFFYSTFIVFNKEVMLIEVKLMGGFTVSLDAEQK